jgi:hypothetical protein
MLSGLLKFILGFVLAIAVLIGSGLTVALYFVNRTAIPPTRPVFANDSPAIKPPKPKGTPAKNQSPSKSQPKTESTPKPSPTDTPKPTPTESPNELPPGAYIGRITWPQGLRLRTEPKQDAERLGGAGANEKIIVLEESDDKVWQKIRVVSTNQEGWVKAANTEKVDDNQKTSEPEKPQPTEQPEDPQQQ